MQKLLAALLLTVSTSALLAQNCPDRVLGTVVGNGDDVMLPIQSIGFAFPFAGTTYTDVHICTNGYMQLSNASVPAPGAGDGTATAAELVAGSPRICALWSDHNLTAGNGANVYINSTPTKCTITWDRCVHFGFTAPLFSFQAQLFATGEIKFFYDANSTNNSTLAGYLAGLVGVSPGVGAILPAVSNLSAGGATADNTLYEDWLVAATFDMQSQSLHLVPTGPGWAFLNAPLSGCAIASNYGTGCYKAADSYYEYFATAAAMDLNGKTISMLRSANGYLVLDSIPGTFVPPSGGAVQIVAGDDATGSVALSAAMPIAGGSTNTLFVSSNGNIALSAITNGNAWTPTTAAFLAWAQTAVAVWHDYNNALPGSGVVKFEEASGIAYVTYDNVFHFGTTTGPGDQFQFQFNVATGDVTIVFNAMNPAGNGYLVGYSVGGASANPGALDLSTALAIPQNVFDTQSVELKLTTSGGLPYFGNTAFSLDTSNVPNLVPLAFMFFGDTVVPGIDLGFIGAPNCRAYTNANLGSLTFPVSLPAGTGSQPFAIPTNLGLLGVTLTCQSVAFTLLNSLGLATSNGTTFTIGG